MLYIFGQGRGFAAAHMVAGLPAVVLVEHWNEPKRFKAAITGYRFGGQTGFQALHTLREVIYLYVFGERFGQLQLSGVVFQGLCGGDRASTGVDDLFDYYNGNRLSASGQPVLISLGITTALNGFLIGFDLGVTDPATGLGQFTLTFGYPPKRRAASATAQSVADNAARVALPRSSYEAEVLPVMPREGPEELPPPSEGPEQLPPPHEDNAPAFGGIVFPLPGLN